MPPCQKVVRRVSQASAARETQLLDRRRAAERRLQSELARRMPHQADCILTEQPLAGAIDEHQTMLVVERKDGHVDLGHHRAEERRGFLRAQALHAQRLGERVDFEHHVRQRIAAWRLPRADREVAFAHGREQIRDRLERTRDAIAHDDRQRDPRARASTSAVTRTSVE